VSTIVAFNFHKVINGLRFATIDCTQSLKMSVIGTARIYVFRPVFLVHLNTVVNLT